MSTVYAICSAELIEDIQAQPHIIDGQFRIDEVMPITENTVRATLDGSCFPDYMEGKVVKLSVDRVANKISIDPVPEAESLRQYR